MSSPDIDLGAGFGTGAFHDSENTRRSLYPPDFLNEAPHHGYPIEGLDPEVIVGPEDPTLPSPPAIPQSEDIYVSKSVPYHRRIYYPRSKKFSPA